MERETTTPNGYRFRLVNIECLPNSANFNVIMDLQETIAELLPYLAAALPGCSYTVEAGVINLMDKGHIIAIYPTYLTITDVTTHAEAERYCRDYFQKIQEVKRNRANLQPVFTRHPTLSPLDILRALPKTNCQECGSVSCMAFAAAVFRREASITACAPLVQEQENYRDLFRELQRNGYQT
ncbi:(Fe-S)-binding protein [Desulfoferrobacter suflitae]|uniref:(Fe-S)-binding protein n=1 Tax=Desulfoferrobacter suflitae TaxID=2865782 RepID=UPI0021647D7D|nr:(Fe-S)-binding protein [Desulfoferrobacter suflitae]MCK8602589.1 hypothetical protein [Desulfoferrobacter suflitae]